MADVTISSLPLGTPSGNALLPFSQGGTTFSARPSAFVAASSGSVLQMQFVPYVDRYDLKPIQQTWQPVGLVPSVNLVTRGNNSKIVLLYNFTVQVYNAEGGAASSFLRNNVEITNKNMGIVTRYYIPSASISSYWGDMTVNFVDSPNVPAGTSLSYVLAVKRTINYPIS